MSSRQTSSKPQTVAQNVAPQALFVNAFLRGLAIFAVLLLHYLSKIPGGFWPNAPAWQVHVILNQVSRFAVPLFVALSGYIAWQKDQAGKFHFFSFLFHQAQKLLPLYILASTWPYIRFFWFNPSALSHIADVGPRFFWDLVNGSAMYHLYFVPMIFQLYLLLPLLLWCMRRWSIGVLGFLAGAQLIFFWYIHLSHPGSFVLAHLGTDQQQYYWAVSWIFYFALGMRLGTLRDWICSRSGALFLVLGATLLSLSLLLQQSVAHLVAGVDPVIALSATQPAVLLFATCAVPLLFTCAHLWPVKRYGWVSAISWLGNQSYPIYLFHVIILELLPASFIL